MARRVSDDALNVVLQHWYTQIEDHPNIFIDHAHILHRFGFAGEAREQLIKGEYTHPDFIKDFKKPGDDISSFTFINRMQILGNNIDYKRVFWGFAEAPKLASTEQRIANSKPNVNLISNFKPTDPQMTDFIQRLPPQLPPDR